MIYSITANELTSSYQWNQAGYGTYSYQYGDWGRTTRETNDAGTRNFAWRYGDKLAQITSTVSWEPDKVTNVFDGLGRRRSQAVEQTAGTFSSGTAYRSVGWRMPAVHGQAFPLLPPATFFSGGALYSHRLAREVCLFRGVCQPA